MVKQGGLISLSSVNDSMATVLSHLPELCGHCLAVLRVGLTAAKWPPFPSSTVPMALDPETRWLTASWAGGRKLRQNQPCADGGPVFSRLP